MAKKSKPAEGNETPAASVDMSVLAWGDNIKATLADIPAVSLFALAQRGFTHIMGNEVAASVTAEKKRRADKGEPELSESDLAAFADAKRSDRLQAILDGKLGVRIGTARLPTIERVMREIAEERLRADAVRIAAKSPSFKLPSGKSTITVGGKDMTLADMIGARVIKQHDDIKAEAERRMAANAPAEGVDIGADDLV